MVENNNMTNDEWKDFFRQSIAEALASANGRKKEYVIPKSRACELLHKDPSTLYRWEKSGYLVPVARRGRSIFYSSQDLERLGVIPE